VGAVSDSGHAAMLLKGHITQKPTADPALPVDILRTPIDGLPLERISFAAVLKATIRLRTLPATIRSRATTRVCGLE
jgi:hypothetical protein